MEVRVAEKRGFCFGVEAAIELAEGALREHGPGNVISLGPVIHNRDVVSKLERAGLIQSGDLDRIKPGSTILIRSHGASPRLLEKAHQRNLKIIDATCILVKKAQEAVRTLHEEGYRVVVIGNVDHPEVQGILDYAPNVIVLDHVDEIDLRLPERARLGIVAQTTHSPEHVGEIIGEIAKRPFQEIKIVNTLCLEVVRRQQAAVALCAQVDVMFVLGGLHSANTQELARLCREQNVPTYHLENKSQFEASMVTGRKVAGVTAGASTPEWVLTEFVEHLRSIPE